LLISLVNKKDEHHPDRAKVDSAYLREADKDYAAFRKRVRAGYPEAHRRLDAILRNAQALRL
jgi:hypothetical protein